MYGSVFQVISLQVFPPKSYMHLSSPTYMPSLLDSMITAVNSYEMEVLKKKNGKSAVSSHTTRRPSTCHRLKGTRVMHLLLFRFVSSVSTALRIPSEHSNFLFLQFPVRPLSNSSTVYSPFYQTPSISVCSLDWEAESHTHVKYCIFVVLSYSGTSELISTNNAPNSRMYL